MSDEAPEPLEHLDDDSEYEYLVNGGEAGGNKSDADPQEDPDTDDEEEEPDADEEESDDSDDEVLLVPLEIFEESCRNDNMLSLFLSQLKKHGLTREELMELFAEAEDFMKDKHWKEIRQLYGANCRGNNLRTKLKEIFKAESELRSESGSGSDSGSGSGYDSDRISEPTDVSGDEKTNDPKAHIPGQLQNISDKTALSKLKCHVCLRVVLV